MRRHQNLALAVVLALALLAGLLWWQVGRGDDTDPGVRATTTRTEARGPRDPDHRRSPQPRGTRDQPRSTPGHRSTQQSSLPSTTWAELPVEARRVRQLLLAGGPFDHRKDGTVYRNRNRALPSQPQGYYREFTVPTPGASDRGARRIVVGGCGAQVGHDNRPRTKPCTDDDEFYYTDDHYETFQVIR